MREIIDINEIRSVQIGILDFIDKVCRENKIHYSLGGGTLLGAVRHKGYIPWDDDIDIFLLRSDYERLINILLKSNSKFRLLNCFFQKDYYFPFSKLVDTDTVLNEMQDRQFGGLGLNIDIFPVDNLPNDNKQRRKYWNKMRIIKRIGTMVHSKSSCNENFLKRIFRKIMFFMLGFIPANCIAKKINNLAIKNNFAPTAFIACSVFGYGEKEEMPRECFSSFIQVEFNGKHYPALCGYDTYLKNLYGDYMTMPPKEKQVAKHEFNAYFKD